MVISGGVVLGVFGLVFTAFAALIGIIWRQNTARMEKIEEQAQRDRVAQSQVTQRIFDALDKSRDALDKNRTEVLDKLDDMNKSFTAFLADDAKRFQRCLGEFQTRSECDRTHSGKK